MSLFARGLALILGTLGLLACLAAVGAGWWASTQVTEQMDRLAPSLEKGLANAQRGLERAEGKIGLLQGKLDEAQKAAQRLRDTNPNLTLPVEQTDPILEQLRPALDRADAIADTLRSLAEVLRSGEEFLQTFSRPPEELERLRRAARTLEQTAEELSQLLSRIESLKANKGAFLTRELVAITQQANTATQRLVEALAATRELAQELSQRVTNTHTQVRGWIAVAVPVNTLLWLWLGLGQVCLIAWGLRRGTPAHSSS